MYENNKVYRKILYASYLRSRYAILRKIPLKSHVSSIGNVHVWSQNGGSISNIQTCIYRPWVQFNTLAPSVQRCLTCFSRNSVRQADRIPPPPLTKSLPDLHRAMTRCVARRTSRSYI